VESVVQCEHLTKKYGNRAVLDEISLDVPAGDVCAILGRNGAGKTTLLRLALGLAFPNSGVVRVLGGAPGAHNDQVAFLSENVAVYPHLTAVGNLQVVAGACGLPSLRSDSLDDILQRVSLAGTGRKTVASYSLGMKRRLQLAMATMVRPHALMILDEPTNGLDVEGMLWLRRFLSEERDKGTSILIASHALSDMQEIITSYAILHEGRIVRREAWDPVVAGAVEVVVDPVDVSVAQRALVSGGGRIVASSAGSVTVAGIQDLHAIYQALYNAGVVPRDVGAVRTSLEHIFLEVTGECVS